MNFDASADDEVLVTTFVIRDYEGQLGFFILARLVSVSLYLKSVRDELDILIRTILILYLGWKVTLHMLLMT